MNNDIIIQNIRELIYKRGMTIEQFAELVSLPCDTIRSIIYGKCKDYKLSTIAKISFKCGLTIDELVYKKGGTAV